MPRGLRELQDVTNGEAPRPLIGVALLPSIATLGNLLSGALAIFCCLLSIRAEYFPVEARQVHPQLVAFFPSYIAIGAYLIVLAMICDALDGRLARLARRTSEFGAQLDSISDIVSFGVAPALLMLTIFLRFAVPAEGQPLVSHLQWRLGLLAALVYISCAAIRLARYNAENVKDEAGQSRFSGLPSPGAAAAFVAAILLHEDIVYASGLQSAATIASVLRWALPPVVFCLGILMVSRLDYVHVFNVYVRREHPPTHLIWVVVAIGIGWYSPQVLLVVLAYAYVLSGLLLNVARGWPVRRDKTANPKPDEAEVDAH